jgi:serine/threonine protein kinase/formylglycine-generating enzyme required for sulfatase activity
MSEEPTSPSPKPAADLHGLDPGELLARGLHTVKATGNSGPWEPPTPEELAKLLPQYLIESLLGRGGMGAVYKGVQAALDRPVAIKLLPSELAGDADFIARFQREARTLARLQHSGIVSVHDFGQTSAGHLYFVMEFVDGTDLQQILKGPGLKPEQAFELIAQICDALYYAHRQGVIHRDIKPANILLTKDGRAKVADFGLARPLTEEALGLTQTNMIMGTPDYMAPETRTGAIHGDHRADIFALGVMLYEMLTGQRPHGAFQPPSKRVQVDVRIDEVVLKALQQEPDRRYQQASEMKIDVDRIRTTPPEKAKPARKPLSKVWIIAGVANVVIFLAIYGAMHWSSSRSTAPDVAAAPAVMVPPANPTIPVAAASPSVSPASATKDAPFVNTLGMKFVPVPITGGPTGGQRVLFSVWETRVQDYEVFVKEAKRVWSKPVFAQGPTHPAVKISWDDAMDFCDWLTERERKAGHLGANERYRLPSDHEWSCAVGIGGREDEARTPIEKSGQLRDTFPWGSQWPPPADAGNYAGEELSSPLVAAEKNGAIVKLPGWKDLYATTAPVGSFAPSANGLFDLSGNAWEWCEDWIDAKQIGRVHRGGGWRDGARDSLTSASRYGNGPGAQLDHYGFRVVLAPAVALAATAKSISEAKKRLADARAQFKVGDQAEARKLTSQALDSAGTDLGIMGEAALLLAELQAPERALKLATDFAKAAEADHPFFAPVAELRIKLAPKTKQYDAHLAAAAKALAAHDDEAEQRELQAALEVFPDGQLANERAQQNPLLSLKPNRGRNFTNNLGQKFVPLPSQPHLLFCIWEARVKDIEAFVQETGYQVNAKTISPPPNPALPGPYSWRNPGFPQTGDHPAVGVGKEDAWALCQWLTQKARAAGQLQPGQVYRLPTDREWSAAMGVTGEAGDFPEQRKFPENVWSWGKTWPPPANAENLSGRERKESFSKTTVDDWVWTAPVGSGKPNPFGLYDLCGNVRELCKDHSSIRSNSYTVRGLDYANSPPNNGGAILRSPGGFGATTGFRCIIDLQTPERLPLAQEIETAIDAYLSRLPKPALEKRYLIDYLVNEETVSLELPGNLGGRGSPTDDDLTAFADLPIERLYIPGAFVYNFAALQKMPLKVLFVSPLGALSFDGVKRLPLEWFGTARGNDGGPSSLEPLRGLKLKGLMVSGDGFKSLTDLSPLQGQPLQILDVSGTSVADLSPVKAAPLEMLMVRVAALTDPSCVAWWPKLRDIGGLSDRLYTPVREALAKGDDKLALLHLDTLEGVYGDAPWFGTYRGKAEDLRRETFQRQIVRWQGGDHSGIKEKLQVFQGHAYLVVRAQFKFDEAKALAEKLGGHLLTVTSKEENEFIKSELLARLTTARFEPWLGLTGEPNKEEWKWVTGEPFTFQGWDRFNGNVSGGVNRGDQLNNANFHYGSNSGVVPAWVWWHGGTGGTRPFIIEWETAHPAGAAP